MPCSEKGSVKLLIASSFAMFFYSRERTAAVKLRCCFGVVEDTAAISLALSASLDSLGAMRKNLVHALGFIEMPTNPLATFVERLMCSRP